MDTDLALVVLTAVYVVATIFICVANVYSAMWTKRQTAELIRQFGETNRARLTVRFDRRAAIERSFVVKNIGLRPATDVQVTIDDAFLFALDQEFPENTLKQTLQSRFIIAPGQEYWFLAGLCSRLDKMLTPVAHIRITYRDGERNYTEEAVLDFRQYDFMTPMSETTA